MKKKYFLSIAIVFVISLIYSRFMVSVSMMALTLWAFYEIKAQPELSLRSFIKDYSFSGLVLVFIAILLSGINSENQEQWLLQIKLKLPFLFLPLAFYAFRSLIDQKMHKWIHYAFIATAFISTFGVFANFFLDMESITNSIGKGKSIPTPLDHIHYSIMLSYAVISSAIFFILETERRIKWSLLIVCLYLFGFMHFLSVRTGLALSYVGLGMVLLWYVIRNKKFVLGLVLTALLVAIPFIAFKTIEPFKRKINYMFWDLAQYQQGKGKSYSDSERLMSYAISFDLIKENPWFGHGIGDLRTIMTRKHLEKYGEKEKYIYPHNQYLYILTCLGILGSILFFFGLLSPLILAQHRNIFLLSLFALMLISFLVENTIQRAVITAFYLFFILLNLCRPQSLHVVQED